jgi:hypothetical protein
MISEVSNGKAKFYAASRAIRSTRLSRLRRRRIHDCTSALHVRRAESRRSPRTRAGTATLGRTTLNPRDPNITLIELVVKRLGHLSERFVDLITEISSMGKYYELHEELKRFQGCGRSEPHSIAKWRRDSARFSTLIRRDQD